MRERRRAGISQLRGTCRTKPGPPYRSLKSESARRGNARYFLTRGERGRKGPGRSGGYPPELPRIRACRLPAPGSSSHEFATCAIRRRCVDTAQVSVYLACFPQTGHETAPPSLGGVPRVGSPASTVLWGAATPCRPSRRTSFPSLKIRCQCIIIARPTRENPVSEGKIRGKIRCHTESRYFVRSEGRTPLVIRPVPREASARFNWTPYQSIIIARPTGEKMLWHRISPPELPWCPRNYPLDDHGHGRLWLCP